jgi:CheY-like chemotaxis protein
MSVRLLIVEDNEINLDMLARRLAKQGYEILTASNGQQGIDMTITEQPDLVLMDMSLPIVDGWEATRKLKDNPKTRHIPIIALTAHAMASDREKSLQTGCDDYDTKPIELPRLLQKIEACLQEARLNSLDPTAPQQPTLE